jgi:hypothetical protein
MAGPATQGCARARSSSHANAFFPWCVFIFDGSQPSKTQFDILVFTTPVARAGREPPSGQHPLPHHPQPAPLLRSGENTFRRKFEEWLQGPDGSARLGEAHLSQRSGDTIVSAHPLNFEHVM